MTPKRKKRIKDVSTRLRKVKTSSVASLKEVSEIASLYSAVDERTYDSLKLIEHVEDALKQKDKKLHTATLRTSREELLF